MSMPTLNQSISFNDVLANMGDEFKNVVANLTMTSDQKAKYIVQKALDNALAKRETARRMRSKMILIKDADDASISVLEAYELKEKKLLTVGGELTAKKNALGDKADAALDAQIGQVAKALKDLRDDVTYQTLEESYETAKEAYEIALETANKAEANYKVVSANLPMLVQAFEVYKEAKKDHDDAAAGAKDQFDPNTFMKGVAGDLQNAKADLRAAQDVDRDLDAMKPVDPVADLLAAHDAASVDAGILDEFAKAAKKVK